MTWGEPLWCLCHCSYVELRFFAIEFFGLTRVADGFEDRIKKPSHNDEVIKIAAIWATDSKNSCDSSGVTTCGGRKK
jgi:hypothetical protein